MRTALLYGLWAAVCYAVTDLTVVVLMGDELRNLHDLGRVALIGAAVFALAGLGWALWHHRGRRPGVFGYGLLALAVTLSAHFAFVALLLSDGPGGLDKFLPWSVIGLALHGWFTVPVALLATWAFVRWQRP